MAVTGGKVKENMVADSNEVIEFKLVKAAEDIQDESLAFKPVMSHQIFGDQENIYGYSNLSIKLYFSAARLSPYLEINYSKKVDPSKHEDLAADDVKEILTKQLGISLNSNLDEFVKQLDSEVKFRPPGALESVFEVEMEDSVKPTVYEIYFCDLTTPGLIEYHKRLQTFLLWYIDAASYIDMDDDKWKFFLIFEKVRLSNGDTLHAVAGYATVYEYYAYPSNIRPRISQVLVLPPYQRQGLGAALLSRITDHYVALPHVVDITVEDPSENLQLVRDYVDCKNCMSLLAFQPSQLWEGRFGSDAIKQARDNFRINKKQTRRVYEILKLRNVNKSDAEQYFKYRIEVKRRLNVQYVHERIKLKKLEQYMKPQELAEIKAAFAINDEQRKLNLENSYKQLETQYERVIARLAEV